jgi:hypothetical protein
MPNIIGEEFSSYVCEQIKIRQAAHGAGAGGGTRTNSELIYLNSKSAWVKFASGIFVEGLRIAAGGKDEAILDGYSGTELAKSFVLFNTVSELKDGVLKQRGTYTGDNNIFDSKEGTYNVNASRTGYATGDFGLTPPPGIVDMSVKCLNRGSVKKATVNIKCYTPEQFEIINMLYLRIGYTMFLEWGWSPYLDNSGNLVSNYTTLIEKSFFTTSKTHRDFLDEIIEERRQHSGNYDGLLCKVTNFSWVFNNDGSYSIEISLLSLGDIIETLKTNITPSKPVFDQVNGLYKLFNAFGLITDKFSPASVNNSITAYLFLTELGIDQRANPNGYPLDSLRFYSYTTPSNTKGVYQIPLPGYFNYPYPPGWNGFEEKPYRTEYDDVYIGYNDGENDLDEINPDAFYMRLGFLLNFIDENIIPKVDKGGTLTKYFDLEYGALEYEENYMYYIPYQFSADPRVCIIATNEAIGSFNAQPDANSMMFDELLDWAIDTVEYGMVGQIMNIYVSHNQIRKCIEDNLDDQGDLNLYDFLSCLCTNINKALGGVNNLEPIYDDDEGVLKIIDSSLNVKKTNDCYKLLLYGYKGNTSNFVHSFNLKTEITNEFATMASVGSTAGGYVKGTENTMFSKWNKGLIDRYKEKLVPGDKLTRDAPLTKPEPRELYYSKIWNLPTGDYSLWGCTMMDVESYEIFEEGEGSTWDSTLGLSDEIIDQNISVVTEFYKWCQAKFQEYNQKYQSPTSGFIPINLSITMEGIGGIKIYNAVNVDTRFLPSDYPDSLKFIIKGVDHSLKDGKWTTTIETVSISQNDVSYNPTIP